MTIFVPGDAWAWNVAVRYADGEGTLLDDRERWTVRIEKGGAFEVERAFLGTVVASGELIPSADPKPEILKGTVASDGTLSLKDSATDPVAARVLRRLLVPDRTLTDRLPNLPLVRHALLKEPDARLPGSGLPASLRVEATLATAKVGGKDLSPASTPPPKGEGS